MNLNRTALTFLALLALPPSARADDPVKLSFVFMGCNRIQHGDWKSIKDDDPSSANLPQLSRTFQDLAQLNPVPPYFFFLGDLVVNLEDDDGEALKHQLNAWTPLFSQGPLAGKVTLVPLPGNHEMLMKPKGKDKDDEDEPEIPNPYTTARWLKWLRDSGCDKFATAANGPTNAPPNPDKLGDNQSQMSYSFNIGDVHFVVLNTDTLTTEKDKNGVPYAGWVPVHWVEQDIRAAQADGRVSAIFVLGHKPILKKPNHEEDAILNTSSQPLGDRLQAVFAANDKVRAYLCAHEHLWDQSPLEKSPKVWQVIAGNAGSKLNGKWTDPYFGFSVIKVYSSGKVGLVSYRRAYPGKKHYFSPTPAPEPAVPAPEITLFNGR